MSDFFRINKGLEIDDSIRILHSIGPPGGTPDTDSANVGSICTDNITGDIYSKRTAGVGHTMWETPAAATFQLVSEFATSPTPSSPMGDDSVTIGPGASTAVSGINSVAIGNQSLSRIPGGVVQANGRFASTGDAQVGRYILRGHTASSLETEIFIDGTSGSVRLQIPDDSTWTFKVTFTGHRTDASDGHAGFTVEGVVYRVAGAATVTMLGKVIKTVISKSNRQWDVNVHADNVNGALTLTCVGQTGKIIRWVALVETVEVTN